MRPLTRLRGGHRAPGTGFLALPAHQRPDITALDGDDGEEGKEEEESEGPEGNNNDDPGNLCGGLVHNVPRPGDQNCEHTHVTGAPLGPWETTKG